MTTIEYFLYRILIVCALVVLLNGCSVIKPTPSHEQVDRSPFTGIPCAAPCWHGLEIGKSNENDVKAILPTLTFIDQNTIRSYRSSMPNLDLSDFAPGMGVDANCSNPKGKPCISLTVVDDILTEIVLELNYDVTVDEAIKYLGNPDYVGCENSGAEVIVCYVDLIWINKQIVLTSRRYEGYEEFRENCGEVGDTGKISSSLLLPKISYVSPAQIEKYFVPSTSEFFHFSGTTP
jgi:hypothetical protein